MALFLFAYRVLFLSFNAELLAQESGSSELIEALLQGLRFDLSTSVSWFGILFFIGFAVVIRQLQPLVKGFDYLFAYSFIFI
ncbi:MAG: hypothetical protein GWN00_30285, partial [Aliifodinibius sp.]|nr:hypothetical protein [Fodinibius sp.]NIV15074.1 hypothetical protein [Fodinibius sp.]NIY28921.1 hypothetical protein [Fodinibius sp.]